MKKVSWALLNQKGVLRGIYSSKRALKNGVDYWKELFPQEILSFEEWKTNYPKERISWDWAYIPTERVAPDVVYQLRQSSGNIPNLSFWGANLIGVDWLPDWGFRQPNPETHPEDYV